MSCRRRPLHTCGVSLIDMAHNVYRRARQLNWPIIGYVTNKLSTLCSPLAYAFQYLLLSILSFLDNRLLSFQNRLEAIFPPSKYALDQIDGILQIVEAFPTKFNEALDEFPALIHRVPFLDWALVHAVSWLDFWLFVLVDLLKEGPKERDIVIDIKCDDRNVNESESGSPSCSEIVSPRFLKGSYKEVLEKGTKESAQEKLHCENGEIVKNRIQEEESLQGYSGESETRHAGMMEKSVDEKDRDYVKVTENFSNGEEGSGDGSASKLGKLNDKDDPILSLFESVWLMKPRNKR